MEEENDTDQSSYVLEEFSFSYTIKQQRSKRMRSNRLIGDERERERKLTRWGLEGGGGVGGVEEDRSSDGEEQ